MIYDFDPVNPEQITRMSFGILGSGDQEIRITQAKVGFKGNSDFELWDAETGGNKLVEGTDYQVLYQDAEYSSLAGYPVYTGFKMLTHTTVDIFGTFKVVLSYIDAEIMNYAFVDSIMPKGVILNYPLNNSVAALGHRVLPLNGQGILRSAYPDLDANVYVGDANNSAVFTAGGKYYHADNSDGSSPSPTGLYLILPDARGRVFRGLDASGGVDPDGASRKLGDEQEDAMQRITGSASQTQTGVGVFTSSSGALGLNIGGMQQLAAGGGGGFYAGVTFDSANSVSPQPAKTNDYETRAKNLSTNYVITY